MPVFVLTHRPPARPDAGLAFRFVTDGVESATRRTRAAAGDRDVTMVGGVDTGQQLLRAGLVDELEDSVMPVLLGGGLRLFEHLGPEPIRLERIKIATSPIRTGIRFRVVKGES